MKFFLNWLFILRDFLWNPLLKFWLKNLLLFFQPILQYFNSCFQLLIDFLLLFEFVYDVILLVILLDD